MSYITKSLDVAIAFWLIAIGPVCWILRDGLGPAAVDSTGLDAISRAAMTFYWAPVMLLLAATRFALAVGQITSRRLRRPQG